ncbi:hypothetical protein Y032_0157g3210 [Ancylostoma ceylanicum]|uniref:Uncharacterized protein n=1 Tax=Ancylostoma ceylanicum TaxID=53326 RepID=A0A016SZ65_9BILA|nr:hypothetical protein Y032_0157g3210 [Ancylostoma ceylanicum]
MPKELHNAIFYKIFIIGDSQRSRCWCFHGLKVGCAVVHYQACLILIENGRISVRDPSTDTESHLNGL